MKSYYLYFVLLVFCSTRCCGINIEIPEDTYKAKEGETFYFLESDSLQSILYTRNFDVYTSCNQEYEFSKPISFMYNFRDNIQASDYEIILFDTQNSQIVDTTYQFYLSYNYDFFNDTIPKNSFYALQWRKTSYETFVNPSFAKLNISYRLNDNTEYMFLSSHLLNNAASMQVEQTYPIDNTQFSIMIENLLQVDLLKTKRGDKKAIRLKELTTDIFSSLFVSLYLYETKNGADELVAQTTSTNQLQNNLFLVLPSSTVPFEGYLEIKMLPRTTNNQDTATTMIPIRF